MADSSTPTPILSPEEVLNAAKRRTPTRMQLADSHEELRAMVAVLTEELARERQRAAEAEAYEESARERVAVLTEERDANDVLYRWAFKRMETAEARVAVLEAGLCERDDLLRTLTELAYYDEDWQTAWEAARTLLGGTEPAAAPEPDWREAVMLALDWLTGWTMPVDDATAKQNAIVALNSVLAVNERRNDREPAATPERETSFVVTGADYNAFHPPRCPTCGSTDRAALGIFTSGVLKGACPDPWHGGETPS